MIKCIASDVDGTLLLEGTKDLNPEYYDVIQNCVDKGILFVLASGRQYLSLKRAFAPVINDVYLICDNGAYIRHKEEVLDVCAIDTDVISEAIDYLRNVPDIYYQISTPLQAFSETNDQELIDRFEKGYQIHIEVVEDLKAIKEPIIKLAVYNKTQDAKILAEEVREKFKNRVDVVVSGDRWFDFVALHTSKGSALKKLMDLYHLDPDACMAFGDNDNDIPMLECVTHSYAVYTARSSVKERVRTVLPNQEDAVLEKIKQKI